MSDMETPEFRGRSGEGRGPGGEGRGERGERGAKGPGGKGGGWSQYAADHDLPTE